METFLKVLMKLGVMVLFVGLVLCIGGWPVSHQLPPESWVVQGYDVPNQAGALPVLVIFLREQGSGLELSDTFTSGDKTEFLISEKAQTVKIGRLNRWNQREWSPPLHYDRCAELRVQLEGIRAELIGSGDIEGGFIYRF